MAGAGCSHAHKVRIPSTAAPLGKENSAPSCEVSSSKTIKANEQQRISSSDWEMALRQAERGHGDMLQVWCDYADWARKQLPAEQASLLQRRACDSLAGYSCYKQDIRQLRLWVRLAEKDEQPRSVFAKLEVRGIGTSHALLYEAWAHCLETQRAFDDAAEVYKRGLSCGAQPQERLRARRAEFDERMRQRAARIAGKRADLRPPLQPEEKAPRELRPPCPRAEGPQQPPQPARMAPRELRPCPPAEGPQLPPQPARMAPRELRPCPRAEGPQLPPQPARMAPRELRLPNWLLASCGPALEWRDHSSHLSLPRRFLANCSPALERRSSTCQLHSHSHANRRTRRSWIIRPQQRKPLAE
eukprot:TRINITY_DN5662_c0_g1_i3.p1 TRINITY_DN5662_c0_g1~~TRINITY_DN5662_c0_g1_i3.p1  ORF type:complete len:369 (+),score=77.33 TRINITY_DN5662_c0_g1_i3:35-1108(+)